MAEERRVIVELRGTPRIAGFAENMVAGGAATLDMDLVPALEGLSYDPLFPPAWLPATTLVDEPDSAQDIGAAFALDERPESGTYVVRGQVDDQTLTRLMQAAEKNETVVGVYSDVEIQANRICPGDPPLGTDQDVERLLCADRLRADHMDGSGVWVAIVDTGFNLAYLNAHGKHPAFDAARSWVPPSGGGVPGSIPVNHGTMCAYDVCIAAPNCTLLDIALLRSTTGGPTVMSGLLSDAVLAYSHLLRIYLAPIRPGARHALVVNNSWGMFHPSWDFPVGHPGNYSDNPSHPFNRIVGTLERAGADIQFAAGNCGRDCPDGRCQGVTTRAIYGANSHPQVLCVAGVDVTGDRVGYSSIGPGRLSLEKPDLCGFTHFRGSGVYAADGGTSAACPVVTGVVAAIRSKMPFRPFVWRTYPAAVRNLLRKTALDRGLVGFDYEYGWGIINGCVLPRVVKPMYEGAAEAITALEREMIATAEMIGAPAAQAPAERIPVTIRDEAPAREPALEIGNGGRPSPAMPVSTR